MSAPRRARGPEELLELELRDVLELPERLEAEDELEPLLRPVLVLEPELEVELDRDLRAERRVTGRSSAASLQTSQGEPLGSYSQASGFPQHPRTPSSPSNKALAGTETAYVCSDRTASYLHRSLAWEEKEQSEIQAPNSLERAAAD